MNSSTHDRCRVRLAGGLRFNLILVVILALLPTENLTAAQADSREDSERAVPRDVLTEDRWQQIDQAVDRGLQHLASLQKANGSWHPVMDNEPGISGLCLMAFLSRGHLPGQGIYGNTTSIATEYLFRIISRTLARGPHGSEAIWLSHRSEGAPARSHSATAAEHEFQRAALNECVH